MTIQRLSSGYWLARFSANQFFQWPTDRMPTMSDGFGWVTRNHLAQIYAKFEGQP